MSEYVIANGWLCEGAGEHTCGTGLSGHFGAHEPGCGLIPLTTIESLLDRYHKFPCPDCKGEGWLGERYDPYPCRCNPHAIAQFTPEAAGR